MRRNALRVLVALKAGSDLLSLASAASLERTATVRAVSDLVELGLVGKERKGLRMAVHPVRHPLYEALREETERFPDLDVAAIAQGRRAALIAGLGFARPVFLREVTALSKSGWAEAMKALRVRGILKLDPATKYRIADGHRPLQAFCQGLCDVESRRWFDQHGLPAARILWSRANEALVAVSQKETPRRELKAAAYTAAARKGLAFLGRSDYFILSQRRQRWPDAWLQCLLVPPRTRLSRAHAAIMIAARRSEPHKGLARWYGLEEEAAALVAFLDEGKEDARILPISEVREIAERYGVEV